MVALAFWDALIASLAFIVALPLLAVLISPAFLIGYVMDAPVVLLPVMLHARRRSEIRTATLSFPAYFVLRTVNAIMMLLAIFRECVLRQRLVTYEKGH
jgi:hypothetical protein